MKVESTAKGVVHPQAGDEVGRLSGRRLPLRGGENVGDARGREFLTGGLGHHIRVCRERPAISTPATQDGDYRHQHH